MPRGIPNKKPVVVAPTVGSELKEGVIPQPKIINTESLKKCVHSADHHDADKKWCNSCGCMKFNGCGE